uniref:RPAP3_C domain-containing protein n=1 Tax=Steinernema glaseri TaxID=37863 RepID=A0A1I8A569_9BILA
MSFQNARIAKCRHGYMSCGFGMSFSNDESPQRIAQSVAAKMSAPSTFHIHVQQQQAHLQAMAAASASAPTAVAEEAEKMDEDRERIDVDRLHGLGYEAAKLKWLIKAHVEGTELRSLFFDVSLDMDVDEIACLEAVRLLSRIPRGMQRDHACTQMVGLLFQKKDMPKAEETDRLITKIIIKAYESEVISFLLAC